jgi:hypothetical protein
MHIYVFLVATDMGSTTKTLNGIHPKPRCFRGLFHNAINIYTTEYQMVGWQTERDFWRKWSWPNWGTICHLPGTCTSMHADHMWHLEKGYSDFKTERCIYFITIYSMITSISQTTEDARGPTGQASHCCDKGYAHGPTGQASHCCDKGYVHGPTGLTSHCCDRGNASGPTGQASHCCDKGYARGPTGLASLCCDKGYAFLWQRICTWSNWPSIILLWQDMQVVQLT